MNRRQALGAAAMVAAAVATGGANRQEAQDEVDPKSENLPANALWLEGLDLGKLEQEWGKPGAAKSVDGNPLRIAGVAYPHGIGTHANSEFRIALGGVATRFVADVGVDDETGPGTVRFEVWADQKKLFDSGVRTAKQPAVRVDVNLSGAKELRLAVTDADGSINFDHADWGGAMLFVQPGQQTQIKAMDAPSVPDTLTIPISLEPDSPIPAIHGPRVVGSTPGRPFLFRIPATGEKPLKYTASGLPDGLSLDSDTGIITGSLRTEGTSVVDLTVTGPGGRGTRKLVIVGGEGKLALTPPLGWNSWNVWGTAVDAEKVRAAADSFVASGLADHGYAYINIDDAWEGKRDQNGVLQTNEKFPDIKALADYVHSKGLKLGIYSSPGPRTCAGYEGSFGFEKTDALTWANWGIDYLKYDWCSYGQISPGDTRGGLMYPYWKMGRALDAAPRDIVYSLCQYGMGEVWTWGEQMGGNCWRTTGDITDTWSSLNSIGFSQVGKEPYAGPGHWNDPDMLIVGWVGWGPNLHPTRLKPDEQVTHITLWSLLAAPLLIGCDLTRLDTFTRAILTNDEVLEVNQDPLGVQAKRVAKEDTTEVWARPLFDGTLAVGFFNRGVDPKPVTARWSDLGLKGRQPIRDLWQKKDLGSASGSHTVAVPGHGALLFKIGRPEREEYLPDIA